MGEEEASGEGGGGLGTQRVGRDTNVQQRKSTMSRSIPR